MEKQKNKSKRKIATAVALGLIAFGGGALAIPYNYENLQGNHLQNSVSSLSEYPSRFLETENLGLKDNFLNSFDNEKQVYSVNEGAVLEALNNENYVGWKNAIENLEGFPQDIEVMSEEDFSILVSLKKASEEGDIEMQKQLKQELGYEKDYPEVDYI
ncbi:MAG: hypothetical protein WC812_02035 [Candidatus Pacearchaeota archaeon]|jgi:hypothetical protein